MKLTLNSFPVDGIEDSRKTALDGRRLLVNREEMRDLLLEDERLISAAIDFAHPGESCRIINILDIFEPRVKIDGETRAFNLQDLDGNWWEIYHRPGHLYDDIFEREVAHA